MRYFAHISSIDIFLLISMSSLCFWKIYAMLCYGLQIFPPIHCLLILHKDFSVQKFWVLCGHTNLLWFLPVSSLPFPCQGKKLQQRSSPEHFCSACLVSFLFFIFKKSLPFLNFILEHGTRDRSNFWFFFLMAIQLFYTSYRIKKSPPCPPLYWFEMFPFQMLKYITFLVYFWTSFSVILA